MATQEDLHVYLINATACLNTPRNSKTTKLFACKWFWTGMQTFPPHLHRVKYEDGTQEKSQTQRGGCMDTFRYLVGPWAGSLQRFPLTGPQGCQRCQICISVLHLCQLQLLHLKQKKKRKKRECAFDRQKYNQYFHWLTQIHVECLGKKQKAVIGDESFILALLISPIAYNKGPKWKACAKTHKYVTCSLTHEWMSVTL